MLIVAHRGVHGDPGRDPPASPTNSAQRPAPGGPAAGAPGPAPGDPRPGAAATSGARPNTLAAFRAAVQAPEVDGVELDVRRTADGVLVVVHDPVADGLVVAHTAHAGLPAWLPTLEEALDACAGLRYVDVEVKNAPHEPGFDPGPGLAEAVVATLSATPPGTDVTVSCFHLATLDAVREAGAERTGWLTLPGYDQRHAVGEAGRRGHCAIAPPAAATNAPLVAHAHDQGLEVLVWTVNDPRRAAELAGWGVDVCITDRPGPAAAAAAAVAAAPR